MSEKMPERVSIVVPEDLGTIVPSKVSIIVPVKDEAGTVDILRNEIISAIPNRNFELVFIDDGSTDGTGAKIEQMMQSDKRVKLITFARNFGKSAALTAGFEEASGEIIITMDGDLQDDPKHLPELLARIEGGADLVSTWKQNRRDPLNKRLPSKVFNRMTSSLSGLRLQDFNSGYKAYRAELAKSFVVQGEMHRYLPVFAHQAGYRVEEIAVDHRPRTYGHSKYGVGRLFKGFLDLVTVIFLTKFFTRPAHVFGFPGLVLLVVSAGVLLGLAVMKLALGEPVGDRLWLPLSIFTAIAGLQLLSLGLIGEFILHQKVGSVRHYRIRQKKGF